MIVDNESFFDVGLWLQLNMKWHSFWVIITAWAADRGWLGVCCLGFSELPCFLSSLASTKLENWVLWVCIKTVKVFLSALKSCFRGKSYLAALFASALKPFRHFASSTQLAKKTQMWKLEGFTVLTDFSDYSRYICCFIHQHLPHHWDSLQGFLFLQSSWPHLRLCSQALVSNRSSVADTLALHETVTWQLKRVIVLQQPVMCI